MENLPTYLLLYGLFLVLVVMSATAMTITVAMTAAMTFAMTMTTTMTITVTLAMTLAFAMTTAATTAVLAATAATLLTFTAQELSHVCNFFCSRLAVFQNLTTEVELLA